MRLYYTGASKHLAIQGIPSKSLGGYISSSLVPNGVPGALFSNPTQNEIIKGGTKCVLIALRNITASDVTNVAVYYTLTDTELYTLEIGLILPGVDSCSDPIFEAISDSKSLPIGIDFQEADSLLNAIILPSLPQGAYVGIWVKMEIDPDANENFNSCQNLFEAFEDPEHPAAQNDFPFGINIQYDI
jgi:hypothetical protein